MLKLKRIYGKLALFLAMIFLISITLCPIYAEDVSEYGFDELKNTTREVFDMYVLLYNDTPMGTLDYEHTIANKHDPDFPGFSRRADKYGKWNDFEKILDSCFTEKVADRFVKYMPGFEHDGYLYSAGMLEMAQFAGIWLDYDFSGSENNFDKSAYVSFDESFKIVSAKENRIVVSFNAMTYGNIDEYVNKDNGGMTYTFEFTKIDDGWRISGGTFVDEYFVYKSWYRIHYAPQTGSEAPVLIAAAVLSLGLVLCIRRRRRAA